MSFGMPPPRFYLLLDRPKLIISSLIQFHYVVLEFPSTSVNFVLLPSRFCLVSLEV